jgi:DnaK suppressor protein
MSTLDLSVFQEILEKDRTRLIDDIHIETDRLNSYTEVNPNHFDLADKRFQQEITAERLRYMNRKLKQVEAALMRITEKTYGICIKCGNPINRERLIAMPYATLCVNCKKRQERAR